VSIDLLKRSQNIMQYSMKFYKIYKVDGTIDILKLSKPLELKEMQKIVDGYIEFVQHDERTFCVDEDGKLKNLKPNPFFPQYVGTIISGTREKGEFVGFDGQTDTERTLEIISKHFTNACDEIMQDAKSGDIDIPQEHDIEVHLEALAEIMTAVRKQNLEGSAGDHLPTKCEKCGVKVGDACQCE